MQSFARQHAIESYLSHIMSLLCKTFYIAYVICAVPGLTHGNI